MSRKDCDTFIFNESDNGGESLSLSTIIHKDGMITQELTLMSYLNSANFNLGGALLTPSNLRNLANQLEFFLYKNEVNIYDNIGR